MNPILPSIRLPSPLFASIDMGTNSFKLLIVNADSSGRFFTIDKLKEPVVLTRETPTSISPQSQLRALNSLRRFKDVIASHNVCLERTRCVATAAVREADNRIQFVEAVKNDLGFGVDVLTGEDEARLAYLGVLQLLPVYDKSVLIVDIGGGSTEFVVGEHGVVKFAVSLKLGHVNLTQRFADCDDSVLELRKYVRSVIKESGLVDKVRDCGGFEVAIGSSGTTRAIEKAVFNEYGKGLIINPEKLEFEEYKRDWRFSKEELSNVVARLIRGMVIEEEKIKKDVFFKRRSEFIVAGAVLLEEIFESLGIKDMEVSDYSLGEGVIAEILNKVYDGYDLNANARWRSVMRLATRFNGKKGMLAAAKCARIAKEIFTGIRNPDADDQANCGVSLEEKDLEYLEAACLLHNVGFITRKKGYHKQSYRIIMNGDHLQGYSSEEVKIIAVLAKYHRKKFPKYDHASLKDFSEEVKSKVWIMCLIIRVSVILQQSQSVNLSQIELTHTCRYITLLSKQLREQTLLALFDKGMAEKVKSQLKHNIKHLKKATNT